MLCLSLSFPPNLASLGPIVVIAHLPHPFKQQLSVFGLDY